MRITKATTSTAVGVERLGRSQNKTACTRNMMNSVIFRVAQSDTQDQNRRPTPLPKATIATIRAASSAVTLDKSMNNGAAWEATEMPAMLFNERNRQSIQNCHVPIASVTV